ncbi:hypothetical protein E5676_scaffold21G005810 [Cucumis melo var. makuwa]|uniref:Uncharacterized protein n=1 Tax=Cucumis melo var. makuwa TaxID=1194695 RepID=A0A5D3CXQ7_CUCMM|nr:hypothetical protein E5676_scaffold21G005810 [Cucumis melo var. makuwa]
MRSRRNVALVFGARGHLGQSGCEDPVESLESCLYHARLASRRTTQSSEGGDPEGHPCRYDSNRIELTGIIAVNFSICNIGHTQSHTSNMKLVVESLTWRSTCRVLTARQYAFQATKDFACGSACNRGRRGSACNRGDAARLHKSARRGFTRGRGSRTGARGRGSGFRKVARVGSGRGAGLRSDPCARGFGFRISGGAAAVGGPATAASLGDGYRLAFRLRLRRIEAARLGWLTGWLRTRGGGFDSASACERRLLRRTLGCADRLGRFSWRGWKLGDGSVAIAARLRC